MGHKKSTQTTKAYLENAPLPKRTKSYTVISHKEVMDHTSKLLAQNNLSITAQLFKANLNAKVAQGIYHLKSNVSDSDLGMMFAWTNSYDKSTRFQCALGAYVFVCNNGMIHGDCANYGRKHTGTANADAALSIAGQISMAAQNFNQLVKDKDDMKNIMLSNKEQAELLGRLFIEEKLLDSQQMSCVKNEMNKPSYDYNVDPDTAWMFYNHVTYALKQTHPRNWMENQSKFHEFMTAELISNAQIQFRDNVTNEDDADIDYSNQIETSMKEEGIIINRNNNEEEDNNFTTVFDL